jgi:hypothetical protein
VVQRLGAPYRFKNHANAVLYPKFREKEMTFFLQYSF